MNKQQFLDLGLTEEQATKAAAASETELSTFVPKHRFDEVTSENKTLKTTVKDHETQLETLGKAAKDNETLSATITQLQADNKAKDAQHQEELQNIKIDNAITASVGSWAQDAGMVAGLIDRKSLVLKDDGSIIGLDEQVTKIKTDKPFLVKPENPAPNGGAAGAGGAGTGKPGIVVGGNGGGGTPPATSSLASAIASRISGGQQ